MEKKRDFGYEVKPLERGFHIIPRGEGRIPDEVVATLNDYGFWDIKTLNVKDGSSTPSYLTMREVPMYSYYTLTDNCVELLYTNWKPPKGKGVKSKVKDGNGKRTRWTPTAVNAWMKKTTGKTLNARLMECWKSACDRVSPEVVAIHKRLYSTAGGKGDWNSLKQAFDMGNEYFLDDIMKYRPAAISLLYDYEDLWKKDWMLSYSYNGEKYTSLTKTLMNMPGGIVPSDMLLLRHNRLPEPVTTRLKLMAYLAAFAVWCSVEKRREQLIHVVSKSTEQDVKDAILYMWHYFPDTGTGDFRKIREIRRTLGTIFDYGGEIGDWNIMGLAKRSEVYHHHIEMQRRMQEEQRQKHEASMALSDTALPPIPLPTNPKIKFLDTYGAVVEEGTLMEHCIAQYAGKAVVGDCYLFHVDYNGEPASVEVNPNGYVSQAYGKRDKINKASKYAERELTKWAKELQGIKTTKKVKVPVPTIGQVTYYDGQDIPF